MYGNVSGLEIDTSLVHKDNPYRNRIYTQPLGSPVYQSKRFDLITALDVVEHITDDAAAIQNMARMLRDGGRLLITVPAFMALWDEHDEMNLHHRRYTVAALRNLLAPHGRIVQMRYLFPSLFLPKLAIRCVNKMRRKKVPQHRLPSPRLNQWMTNLCLAEHELTSWMRIPFGTSVMAILEKPIEVPAIMPHLAAA